MSRRGLRAEPELLRLDEPSLGLAPRIVEAIFAVLRQINRDAIEEIVQDRVRTLEGHALIQRLVACGVPAGPVNTIRDVFEDPFVAARGTVHRFVREDGVEIPSVAFPGKLSETPASYRVQPPRVGEHSREVLAEWLSLDTERLDQLHRAGTIAQR